MYYINFFRIVWCVCVCVPVHVRSEAKVPLTMEEAMSDNYIHQMKNLIPSLELASFEALQHPCALLAVKSGNNTGVISCLDLYLAILKHNHAKLLHSGCCNKKNICRHLVSPLSWLYSFGMPSHTVSTI